MTLSIGMVTIDCEDPARLAEFWTQALDMTILGDYGEFILLGAKTGNSISLGLQRVPERRTGKNSVHIDLRSDLRGGADRAAEVRRLTGLGATQLAERSAPGLAWTVLADPEGNQFCVGEYTG